MSKTIRYQKELAQQFSEIDKLIQTPDIMRTAAIDTLRKLSVVQLSNQDKITISNSIKLLENISNASLKKEYQIIYHQACVLAVSALEATLKKYFINYISGNWTKLINIGADIKFTFEDLAKIDFKITPNLGALLLEKDNSINFQDLSSTIRNFEKYG